MSTDAAPASALPRSRPTTRSSIRHSLTLASVGKALADVMHKENKESPVEKEKSGKKAKDTSSRRSSVIPAPRASIDRPVSSGKKERETSPEAKTITRNSRRLSAIPKTSGTISSEDQSSSSPASNSPKRTARTSTLRPRNSAAGSALPKYRPKSVLIESVNVKAPPSPPARAGIRRRLSISEDEKEEVSKQLLHLDIPKSAEKSGRAISPLPHRGALKVNLTAAINVTPTTPEKKTKPSTPTPSDSPTRLRASPTRLPAANKTLKSSKAPGSASSSTRTVARPPSSASSSSSRTPRTPTTPTAGTRPTHRSGGSTRLQTNPVSSPLRSTMAAGEDSPLANITARRRAQNSSPSPCPSPSPSRLVGMHAGSSLISTPTPIILTADSSIDSMDASDVEYMLSTIASPSAPTPALPRFRTVRASDNANPQTPPRPTLFLPLRSQMSYLSPAGPNSDGSPFLRPKGRQVGNERGSILSWEQLAQHSRSMGQDDMENMLADIDAPFSSVTASPAPSTLSDIPESPNLSALPSPTGYGSISQVLLPDVTPSPAIFNATLRFDEMAAETPPGDSGSAMMLRLQLAAAEGSAREQQSKIEALEAQLQTAKEARMRDTEDLARQITYLEEQIQQSLRPDEQLLQYVRSLEEQLSHAQAARNHAVDEALKEAQLETAKAQNDLFRRQQLRCNLVSVASAAGSAWTSVRCEAGGELEYIRSSQDMLTVLLAGLDNALQQL